MSKKGQEPVMFFDAFTRIGLRPKMHRQERYSLEHLIEEMRHCSISGALVSSFSTVNYDPLRENLALTKALARHENLFPIWNAMPHWTGEFPEPDEFIDLMRENDVRAVMLNPVSNGWNVLSSTSKPLMKILQYYRILTIIDVRKEIDFPTLEQFLGKYPELPLLLVGGWWNQQRQLYPLLIKFSNLNVSFDHLQVNNGLEWLVGKGCEEQLVFASNAPSMSMGAHRAYIDYAALSSEQIRKVASANLIGLLNGQKPPAMAQNSSEDTLMKEARIGKPLSCTVLDFHSHVLDEGLDGGGGCYTCLNGGPSGLRSLAERMGVDGIGVMSWNGTVGAMADEGNECTRAALDALPKSCWGLYTPDPVHDDAITLKKKMTKIFSDRRFIGIKPYITYGIHYDAPAYEAVWEFGNRHGLYALIHPNRGDLSELDVLCVKYPKMSFAVAHCGGSFSAADNVIAKARKYPNVYAEITLTPVCLGIIEYLVQGCGVDRVLYGSDQPMRDPRQQLGWVVYSKLSLADKKKVLGLNAKKLIDRIRAGRKRERKTG